VNVIGRVASMIVPYASIPPSINHKLTPPDPNTLADASI